MFKRDRCVAAFGFLPLQCTRRFDKDAVEPLMEQVETAPEALETFSSCKASFRDLITIDIIQPTTLPFFISTIILVSIPRGPCRGTIKYGSVELRLHNLPKFKLEVF